MAVERNIAAVAGACQTLPGTMTRFTRCQWAHASHVPNEQVINEDYNDFVSLSTKLVNVDGSLQRMQAPLLELQVMHCCSLTAQGCEQLGCYGSRRLVAVHAGAARAAGAALCTAVVWACHCWLGSSVVQHPPKPLLKPA